MILKKKYLEKAKLCLHLGVMTESPRKMIYVVNCFTSLQSAQRKGFSLGRVN